MAKARNVNPGQVTRQGTVKKVRAARDWDDAEGRYTDCIAIHWVRGSKSGVTRVKPNADVKVVYTPKSRWFW